MKVVCHELAAASNDPEGSLMDDLVKDADKLISCLAAKVNVHNWIYCSRLELHVLLLLCMHMNI